MLIKHTLLTYYSLSKEKFKIILLELTYPNLWLNKPHKNIQSISTLGRWLEYMR